MLTLTFTSVGHPECVLGTARWRLRRAQTRRVGPLFRRGGSPELRASSLVESWGAHRLSTRWNMSTDNRLAEPPGDRNSASTGSPLWRIPERRASDNSALSKRRFSAHDSPIARTQSYLSVIPRTKNAPDPTAGRDATGGTWWRGSGRCDRDGWCAAPPMATTDAVMSQSGSVASMSNSRVTTSRVSPQNSQLRPHRSPDLCAGPATAMSAQKLTASRPPR